MRSTEIVTAFWDEVWNAHEPDAVDRFVADDVVIEAGGQEIAGKDNIRNWVKEFLDHVNDLHVDTIETFQNDDGTRVTSRWVLTGTNNGILGTEPNSKPIAMTGTAVWTVDENGKLQRGWVEQASVELYHWLLAKERVMRARTGRYCSSATAVGAFAVTGAPSAVADPVATCTSDVIDGVEVDYCVGNPNAN